MQISDSGFREINVVSLGDLAKRASPGMLVGCKREVKASPLTRAFNLIRGTIYPIEHK